MLKFFLAILVLTLMFVGLGASAKEYGRHKKGHYKVKVSNDQTHTTSSRHTTSSLNGNYFSPQTNEWKNFTSRLRFHSGCSPSMLNPTSCQEWKNSSDQKYLSFEYKIEIPTGPIDEKNYANVRAVRFDFWAMLIDKKLIATIIAGKAQSYIKRKVANLSDFYPNLFKVTDVKKEIIKNEAGKDMLSIHLQGVVGLKRKKPCYTCRYDGHYEKDYNAFPMSGARLSIEHAVGDALNSMGDDPDFMK